MYKALARRRVRASFDGLSSGDPSVALRGLADDVHHVFAGDHAVGGERHSRAAVERWFGRLLHLFELRFEIRRILVSGPPWHLTVAVEWFAQVRPKVGEPYTNEGAHVIVIHRGKVTYFHAYEDSQKVALACQGMAAAGIEEAAAAPISD